MKLTPNQLDIITGLVIDRLERSPGVSPSDVLDELWSSEISPTAPHTYGRRAPRNVRAYVLSGIECEIESLTVISCDPRDASAWVLS